MKKLVRVLLISTIMMILLASTVFAGEKFIETKSYTFVNEGTRVKSNAYIEVFVGQKDVVDYEKDEYVKVFPTPDEMKKDEYGNLYAHYDVSEYKAGRSLTITIEKVYEMSDYDETIAVRSESTADAVDSMFTKPQERVDSDDPKIVAKAKEITYGLSSDYKRAKAIFEFVNTNMRYNSGAAYANKGSLSALENLSGVCEEYATLFAALCRAVDIPTKIIDGYRVVKSISVEESSHIDPSTGETVKDPATYKYELIPHIWNEIYFDDYGWVPVDTCVVYTGKDGNRIAYLDSFCKIEGEEYVADGLYNANHVALVWNDSFKHTDMIETVEPYVKKVVEQHKFLDLSGYAWAEDSINTLYNMNVIKGYSETEYGPSGNVSRIEFITMLARVLKNLNYVPGYYKQIYYYSDYDKNHYSKREYDFLMRLLEDADPHDTFAAGYYAMDYVFGTRLDMNKPITRGEVVALMDPFLRHAPDYSTYKFTNIVANKFQASFVKAASNGLIKGYEDGSFRPNNYITRAEIAVIIDRYIGVKDMTI